ncbi:phage tail spike protein [Enterococcus italicus]|uniref:phage tail spike protein n=1 Tax=Enterococcus italicus TaxID=246144 RepID=UPI003F45544C
MLNVFFMDKMQRVKYVADSSELISCVQTREITTNKSELMNDTLSLSLPYNAALTDTRYIAVNQSGADNFALYRVLSDSDEAEVLTFECVNFAIDELDNYIVKDVRPKNKALKDVINQLLSESGCDWILGVCEPTKAITSTFYYSSIKECLKSLQSLGCEFTFNVTITGNAITRKTINCYNKIGKVTNKRFEYGEDVLKIVREQDRTNIVTAIIGRGKGEEVGDGYGRRLEFTDVEWKKANGNPLDKPKGQNYLEYPEMTAEYGIPSNGKMLPRKTVVVFDDVEDANELLKQTYETLSYYCRPLVQFSTEILGSDEIGNTITIHRSDRNYHYQTRVFKVVTDFVSGKVSASLGDNLTSSNSLNRQIANVQSDLSTLDKSKMTFYESTEIGKYQDDIMRGAGKNGGSIYQVNGIEAGVSSSREVYEVIYMDGGSIAESKDFLVQNNAGISFKHCKKGEWTTVQDVHNGASNTAWTLDGVFVADFIRAGTLRAITIDGVEIYGSRFETKNNNGGGKLRINNGVIQMFNDNDKAFGLFRGTQSTGSDSGNSVGMQVSNGSQTDTFTINALNALFNHNKKFSVIAPEISLSGDVNIPGKLKVNGVEISGSGGASSGGGGWSGDYPSVALTQVQKFAWQAWVTLRLLGYSEGAAAGILGNINGEVGPSMNPDTEQVDGPAYGAVQFDGSVYPLIGAPTNNGREYFQRLHNASGVGGDYRDMVVQMKVVNWTMKNGQWIGVINPTTVEGYKAMSDARTAATVFERNFERPASTHPIRSDYAQKWYDLFSGVEITKKDWINPLHDAAYNVTQEWDQIGYGTGTIHGGIDLAPTGGRSPNIYAARSGTVQQIVRNDATGGNYIILKHSDGYWSYYGHLASIAVSQGQNVTTDTVLGICGMTGLATGIHLHFEVWHGGQWQRINPRDVINF